MLACPQFIVDKLLSAGAVAGWVVVLHLMEHVFVHLDLEGVRRDHDLADGTLAATLHEKGFDAGVADVVVAGEQLDGLGGEL